jgi:integrase
VLPGYDRGPLFLRLDAGGRIRLGRLSDRGVARVVQRWAERAGLDPLRFAGHSLRAGLATSAAAGGVSERAIMKQTGHRSLAMVRRYIRDGELFREDNAARGAGL